jgi:hypothetical protein
MMGRERRGPIVAANLHLSENKSVRKLFTKYHE